MPKFSSFNAFGSEALNVGQSHTPVWLGVVSPVPVGGTLDKAYALKGLLLGAGFPVKLASKIITPFIGYEVVSYSAAGADDTYDTVVVKPVKLGGVEIAPEADDVLMKLGATFATAGAARAIHSSTKITSGDNEGCYTLEIAKSANLGVLAAGDVLTPSAEAGASGKVPSVIPNGYLYNDIYMGELDGNANNYTIAATGAVVVNHPEGLIVELTPAAAVKAQMAAAVPGVYQVLV